MKTFALALCLTISVLMVSGCTSVQKTGSDWQFRQLHPFRDASSMVYRQGADGSVYAAVDHMVRPEGESATQGTMRNIAHYGALLGLLYGGFTGNLPLLAGGAMGAEVTR